MSFFATQKNSRVLLTNIKSFPFFIATRIFSLHEKILAFEFALRVPADFSFTVRFFPSLL